MQTHGPASSNYRYNATCGCEFCGNVLDHQPWCDSQNPRVRYAHEVMVGRARLSQADQLYLHALGVAWRDEACLAG